MLWSLLAIAIGAYAGLCVIFFIFQRSFIYMPRPPTPADAAAFTLEVPGATVRVSTRPHDGPKALLFFGGNAGVAADAVPDPFPVSVPVLMRELWNSLRGVSEGGA